MIGTEVIASFYRLLIEKFDRSVQNNVREVALENGLAVERGLCIHSHSEPADGDSSVDTFVGWYSDARVVPYDRLSVR
jgi:hypothetical protein